jgi:hypothetical protein
VKEEPEYSSEGTESDLEPSILPWMNFTVTEEFLLAILHADCEEEHFSLAHGN